MWLILFAVAGMTVVCTAGDFQIREFKEGRIFHDILKDAPQREMKVEFWSGVTAKYGNYLNDYNVDEDPVTEWQFPDDDVSFFFTLLAFDADIKGNTKGSAYLLWLVNNISFNNPDGDVIVKYQGPSGRKHRIGFIVFYHENTVELPTIDISRKNFNIAGYGQANNFTLWAGNFFYTVLDE